MEIRDLVRYLEVEQLAPFHFTKELIDGGYASCKHMTDEEFNDYLEGVWTNKKVYDNSQLGVYLTNMTIDELYKLEQRRNPAHLKEVINHTTSQMGIPIEEYSLIYGIYVILHEVGHWLYFKASGKTSLEYMLWDSEFRRELIPFEKNVRKIPNDSPDKMSMAIMQVRMYKNIPSEKKADEYAFKNMEDKLELVRKYIVKSSARNI